MVLHRVHGALYKSLNDASMRMLRRTGLPPWLTADVVTAGRLTLVLPTMALSSRGHQWAPASLVIVNAALDYVDGAVARYEKELQRSSPATAADSLQATRRTQAFRANWGAYFDAVADKAFAIPVWIGLAAWHPSGWLQSALAAHVIIEVASTVQRSWALLDDPTTSSKVVTADSWGKMKQLISMLGTALLFVDATRVAGGILMWASLPLAVASLRGKLVPTARVLVLLDSLDAEEIAFLSLAKQHSASHLVAACAGPRAETVHGAALDLGPLLALVALRPSISHDWCKENRIQRAVARDGTEAERLKALGVPDVIIVKKAQANVRSEIEKSGTTLL